jgi:hypothetical protein
MSMGHRLKETIAHLRNDAVEPAPGVPEPVLPRRELAEVGSRLWDLSVVQLEHDTAGGLAVDGDVELWLVRNVCKKWADLGRSEREGVRRRFCKEKSGSEYGKGFKGRSSLRHVREKERKLVVELEEGSMAPDSTYSL